jgi:hypothetical protein
MNVLIIEDWKALARALKARLEAAGHNVTWIVGTNGLSGNIVDGIGEDKSSLRLDLSDYQVAFVDGQIEGELQGPAMVCALARNHVACCGMSTSSSINEEMLICGATIAAKKPVVFAAVLSEQLNTERVRQPTHSDTRCLAALENNFTKVTHQELRDEAEAVLAPFLKADR